MVNERKENKEEDVTHSTPAVALVLYAHSLAEEHGIASYCNQASEISCADAVSAADKANEAISAEQQELEQQEHEQRELCLLLAKIKRHALQRRRCSQLFGCSGILTFGMGLMMMLNYASPDSLTVPFFFAALVALFAAVRGVLLHQQMITFVARLPDSDIRAVGPLLEALQYADMEGIPQRALMELLPRLEREDAALFNAAHLQNLYRALEETNTDMVTLALHALEKVGDKRAIPHVQYLAKGGGRARLDAHVFHAAQRCLAVLAARALQDTACQTLLRASEPQSEMGLHLLRPATEQEDVNAHNLLRAAASSNEVSAFTPLTHLELD